MVPRGAFLHFRQNLSANFVLYQIPPFQKKKTSICDLTFELNSFLITASDGFCAWNELCTHARGGKWDMHFDFAIKKWKKFGEDSFPMSFSTKMEIKNQNRP